MTDVIAEFREWRLSTPRCWAESLWPRAFWFDVFLSHRRGDWSRAFADALRSHGVRVYHDDDRPVADAQVQQELDLALKHSRFVAVCASPDVGGSLYCRAEFQPAVEHASRLALARVVVVSADDSSVVPFLDRSGIERFVVNTPQRVAAFAEFVQVHNRVTFERDVPRLNFAATLTTETTETLARLQRWSQRTRSRRSSQESPVRLSGRAMLALSLLWLGETAADVAAGRDADGDSQMLGVARHHILESRSPLPKRIVDYVWRCGHALMGGRSLGLLLVGAEFFVWAARRGAVPAERDLLSSLVLDMLAHGAYEDGCGPLLNRMADDPTLTSVQAAERAAVTCPWLLTSDQAATLIGALPPAARAKLDTPGFDGSLVPWLEALNLVLRRLEYLRRLSVSGAEIALFELESVIREDLARGLRLARAQGFPDGGWDVAQAIHAQLFEPGPDGVGLVSRLEIFEILGLLNPLEEIARLRPAQAGRLIDPLADAVTRAGYPRTAIIVRSQAAAIAAGGEVDHVELSLTFHRERDEKRRAALSHPETGDS